MSASLTSEPIRPTDARAARWFRIGSTALISFSAFESFAVGTVLPQAADQLSGTAEYSTAFGVTVAAMLVSTAVAGPWIDRQGVRPVLLTGAMLFTIGLIAVGVAPSMPALAAGRAIQGLGTGLVGVVLSAMVGRLIPEPERPAVFATFSAAWVLPSLVGPAIAGLIADTAGWRWAFLGVAPLTLLALAAAWQSTRHRDESAFRRPTASANRALLTAAVTAAAALTAAQFSAPRSGTVRLLVTAVALVAALVAGRRASPVGEHGMSTTVHRLVLTNAMIAGAFFSAEIYLPLYLVQIRSISPFAAGSVLTGAAILWAAGAWGQAKIPPDGALRSALPVVGAIILTVSLLSVAVIFAVDGAPALLFIAWAGAGLSMGLTYPTLSVLVLHLSPDREQGAHAGALKLGESLGTAMAIACTGVVFARLLDQGADAFGATMLIPCALSLALVTAAVRARRSLLAAHPTLPGEARQHA